MDSEGTKKSKEKEDAYLKKFEAWKKQKPEKQSKIKGSLPPWNRHCVKEGVPKMNNNRLTGEKRRNTFEILLALRNSPIPLSLLPKVSRSGPPRKGVEKAPEKTQSGKENHTNNQLTVNKQKVLSMKANNAQARGNNRKSLSNIGMNPKPRGAPSLDKRKSCVIPRPSACVVKQASSSSSHQPFIRHTKTSLARMCVLPEVKDDYLERFNRWKAEKTQSKNPSSKSGTSCLEKRKSYVPQAIKQGSRNEVKKGAPSKVPVPVKAKIANTSGQRRRKTISELSSRSNKPLPSSSRCNRRQTVSSTTLNRPTQAPRPTEPHMSTQLHRPGQVSMKRKDLVSEHSVSKRKRVCYSQVTPQKPRQTPRRKTHASLRQELEEWLKAKGKTPSRCRHLMCYGDVLASAGGPCQSHTKPLLSVEEISQQQKVMEEELSDDSVDMEVNETDNPTDSVNMFEEKLRQLLKECLALLNMGCPVESLLAWLARIAVDMPEALKSADFWICKAKLIQSTGNTNRVLEVFEQAVRQEAKPSDALAKELTEMVKEMTTGGLKYLGASKPEDLLATPRTPVRQIREVQPNNMFESSAIMFCVKEKTPLLNRMRDMYGMDGCSPCMIVTPVRRSTRRSLATIPKSLQEKDRLYASVSDIPLSEQKVSLYQVNPALMAESHTHVTEGVSSGPAS